MHNRLDNCEVIAHLLADVKTSVSGMNTHEFDLDLQKIKHRARHEGVAFFTKTLPNLGKAVDSALLGERPLDIPRFRKIPGTRLPKLFGELFKRVFSPDGMVLKEPCIRCIRALRDLTFVFYKYEIPHTQTQSDVVIAAFLSAEEDLKTLTPSFKSVAGSINRDSDSEHPARLQDGSLLSYRESFYPHIGDDEFTVLVKAMRREGFKLFSSLQLDDIWPNHGPGVVSTRETNEEKYRFERYSSTLDSVYPFTKYFVPCEGWIEDARYIDRLSLDTPMARVLLVPKDSRGPRLISCEPLENQWIQQGIKSLLVKYIESHPVMGGHVNFTDQGVNRSLALLGSLTGDYATLDLKEASDRVHLDLVRLVFPDHIVRSISVCRTNSTQLPDGRVIDLSKFAPMGSALCFPILASVVWLALTAGNDACRRKTTYVYGDDIIVHRTDVLNAIKRLELIGLKTNVNKSCFTGLFRESCGMDAYKGEQITPFRLRKVWSHPIAPASYVSYIEKSNEAYGRGYYELANYLARMLAVEYGKIPYSSDELTRYDTLSSVPHLTFIPTPTDQTTSVPPCGDFTYRNKSWSCRQFRARTNYYTQKREILVRTLQPVTVVSHNEECNYFRKLSQKPRSEEIAVTHTGHGRRRSVQLDIVQPTRSGVYTHNRASKLVRKWR